MIEVFNCEVNIIRNIVEYVTEQGQVNQIQKEKCPSNIFKEYKKLYK
jgi:hypothetical protein